MRAFWYLCRIHTRLPQVVGMDHQAVRTEMPTTNQKAEKLWSIVYLRTWPSNVWTMGFFLMTVLSIFVAKVHIRKVL